MYSSTYGCWRRIEGCEPPFEYPIFAQQLQDLTVRAAELRLRLVTLSPQNLYFFLKRLTSSSALFASTSVYGFLLVRYLNKRLNFPNQLRIAGFPKRRGVRPRFLGHIVLTNKCAFRKALRSTRPQSFERGSKPLFR